MKKIIKKLYIIAFVLIAFVMCEGPMGPMGPQGEKGDKGDDGVSIVWRGELSAAPAAPQLYWAYFNTTDGNAYIYTGTAWQQLSQRGLAGTTGSTGATGVSIDWQGTFAAHPTGAQLNWAYYNSTDKRAYIYSSSGWQMMVQDGAVGPQGPQGIPGGGNGGGILWKGEFDEEPENPETYWAYFNNITGNAYLFTGYVWDLLARGGTDGNDGIDGTPGISISWRGSFTTDPSNPELNWSYYNSAHGISYIFDGTDWQVMTKDGTDGISLAWKGEHSAAPDDP